MNYKRAIVIVAVIILLLLLFLYQPTIETIAPEWTEIDSRTGGAKVYEIAIGTAVIRFDECCEGQVKVMFMHSWDFYSDEWTPEGDCCANPVTWSLRDSRGIVVFSATELCPKTATETITDGVWDCINPWVLTVNNGCLYHINYNYRLTMHCLETESSTGGFDFLDWIIFWD